MKKEDYARLPENYEQLPPRLKKIIDFLNEIKYSYDFQRILDVGCGDGSFTKLLKKILNAGEAYGVDISEEAVNTAQKKGIDAVRLNVDVNKLPFPQDYFDLVFCGELLEHLIDPDNILKEIYKTLNKNGIAIITTPNLASWLNRLVLLFGSQPYYTEVSLKYNVGKLFTDINEPLSGHLKLFTYKALSQLLRCMNFKILKTFGSGVNIEYYRKHVRKIPFLIEILDKIFSKYSPLSVHIIFVVCKEPKVEKRLSIELSQ